MGAGRCGAPRFTGAFGCGRAGGAVGLGLLASLPGRFTGDAPVGLAGTGAGLAEVGLAGADGAEALGAGAEGFGAEGAGAAAGLGRGVGTDGAPADGAPADGAGVATAGALGRLTGFCGAAGRDTGCCTIWGRGAAGREGAEGLGDGFAAAGATGLLGIDGAAGLEAFLTERIVFPGAGLVGGADATALPPCFKRFRILPASVSLMELLWLLAAMDSFSAASRTSLFSKPRSLDNS